MCPYLVGTSGFQHALDYIHVAKAFQYAVVGDGMLAVVAALGEDAHHFPVGDAPADITDDRSGFLLQITPAHGDIFPARCLVKELGRQFGFGFFRLRDDKQTGGILVYPVYQSRSGIVFLE